MPSATPYFCSRGSKGNPDASESFNVGRKIRFEVAEGRAGSAKEIRRELGPWDSERTEDAYSGFAVLGALKSVCGSLRSLRRDLGVRVSDRNRERGFVLFYQEGTRQVVHTFETVAVSPSSL